MEYIIEINTGSSDLDKIITHWFAAGARLTEIVKYATHKGYDKNDVVNGFKQCCRIYGYNNSPTKTSDCIKKPLASDWDGKRSYDELSARHNGIIGPGAALRKMLK